MNNDFSLNQGQMAQYGEYSSTNNSGEDILQATSKGETNFQTSTGFDEQYGSSYDVLQATSTAEGNGAQNGEYQSTDPIIDPGFNLGDFQTTDNATNVLDNQNASYDVLQATSAAGGDAQYGEYKSTNKNEGISSAEELINKYDFTTSTPIADTNQNTENIQGFDINAYQSSDVNSLINTENLTTSTPITDQNTGFDFGEYQTTDTTSNLQNMNEILHQSIEPEEGITGTIPDSSPLVDTNTNIESNIDTNIGFDATAFTTTEQKTTEAASQNFDFNNFDANTFTTSNQTQEFQTGESLVENTGIIDTTDYSKIGLNNEPTFDFSAFQTTTPIVDEKATTTAKTIETKTYQQYQPVVENKSNIETTDLTKNTEEFDINQYLTSVDYTTPTFDNTSYTKNDTTYDITPYFDSTGFSTNSPAETKTTVKTTTTTTQNQVTSPIVDVTSAFSSTSAEDTGLNIDIDKLLSTQNYNTGVTFTEYQTDTQISPKIIETTSIPKPTPIPNIKQAPLPVQTKTTTQVIKQAPIPVQTTTQIIKQAPLPVQTKTTTQVIKQAPIPVQTTTQVIKQAPIPEQTTTQIIKQESPIVDTGLTLGNLESFQQFDTNEIFKNYDSTKYQDFSIDELISSSPTIPVSVDHPVRIPQTTLPKPAPIPQVTVQKPLPVSQVPISEPIVIPPEPTKVDIPEFRPSVPVTIPETIPSFPVNIPEPMTSIPVTIPQPIIPTTLDTGATFGEHKTIVSQADNIQTTFTPPVQNIQTYTTTIPTPAPVQIPMPTPVSQSITVKVPKVQKVIVPKIQKVYVPSKKKIYVKRSSSVPRIAGTTVGYAQSSFVPPQAQIVRVPSTTSITVPKTLPYAQTSFVPPPTPVVAVPRPIPYAQKSVTVVQQPVTPVQTPVAVPRPIPYAQTSFVPPPTPVVPVQTPVAVPRPIPYAQKSVTVVPPPLVQSTATPIATVQPLSVPTIPISAKPPLPTVQSVIQTSSIATPQPQIIQTPMPAASVLGVPNVVKSTVPVQPVPALPVKSIVSQVVPRPVAPVSPVIPAQPIVGQLPQAMSQLPINNINGNPILNRGVMQPVSGMNRPIAYNANTYRPISLGRNVRPHNIGGYRTTSVGSVGSYGNTGNMNRPLQYGTRTYNARRL